MTDWTIFVGLVLRPVKIVIDFFDLDLKLKFWKNDFRRGLRGSRRN